MHANWAVYLCALTCDLLARRTRVVETGAPDSDARPFLAQWMALWDALALWASSRGREMLPISTSARPALFPEILYAHWPAISGNQMYHTACIMMLEMAPAGVLGEGKEFSRVWHARRVIGISLSNEHEGCLINAIQPLWVAGRGLSHCEEHKVVKELFGRIEARTGWGAVWRLRDLERVWGYEVGELSGTA
jgi:hypothetical protein